MEGRPEMASREILEMAGRIAEDIKQKANDEDAYKIVSIVVSLLWGESARLIFG